MGLDPGRKGYLRQTGSKHDKNPFVVTVTQDYCVTSAEALTSEDGKGSPSDCQHSAKIYIYR